MWVWGDSEHSGLDLNPKLKNRYDHAPAAAVKYQASPAAAEAILSHTYADPAPRGAQVHR